MKNRGYIVHLAGVTAMIFWGLSFIWTKQILDQHLNPTTTIFLRLVIATIFFTTILFVFRLNEKVKREHLGLFALAAMFEPFLYFIFETYGIYNTSEITSSSIIAMIPLVTPIAATIFLKEKLTLMNIVGLIVSFPGVILILLNKDSKFVTSPLGLIFLFSAVLVAVCYSLALMKLTKLYKPLTITWVQNIIGMIYFIPVMIIMEQFEQSNFENFSNVIMPLVYLGVFCSAISYALWAFAFSKLGATKANVYSNLIPVFTAIFSFILGTKEVTDNNGDITNKVIGIVIVVVGLFLSQLKKKEAKA